MRAPCNSKFPDTKVPVICERARFEKNPDQCHSAHIFLPHSLIVSATVLFFSFFCKCCSNQFVFPCVKRIMAWKSIDANDICSRKYQNTQGDTVLSRCAQFHDQLLIKENAHRTPHPEIRSPTCSGDIPLTVFAAEKCTSSLWTGS